MLDYAALHALCVERDAVVIIKMHPFVQRAARRSPSAFRDRLLDGSTAAIDVNDLLFAVDLLITDYSSIVFEYSTLGRPMLFFAYDLDEYVATRDFYVPFESFVPGRIVRTFPELLDAIRRDDYEVDKVADFAARHFAHLDGGSTDRVIDELDPSGDDRTALRPGRSAPVSTARCWERPQLVVRVRASAGTRRSTQPTSASMRVDAPAVVMPPTGSQRRTATCSPAVQCRWSVQVCGRSTGALAPATLSGPGGRSRRAVGSATSRSSTGARPGPSRSRRASYRDRTAVIDPSTAAFGDRRLRSRRAPRRRRGRVGGDDPSARVVRSAARANAVTQPCSGPDEARQATERASASCSSSAAGAETRAATCKVVRDRMVERGLDRDVRAAAPTLRT